MTTALTLTNTVTDLTPAQRAVMAEMDEEGNQGFEFIPERIKFGSGGLLAFQTADGSVMQAPIDAIVAIAQRARAFWPSKDTAGLPPLCSSPDGVVGNFDPTSEQVKAALQMEDRHPALNALDVDAARGPWSCVECPLAQFGTGANGAQACKNLRRLAILIKGWAAPAIITLPPTSVKVWDAFASGRKNRGRGYFDTWVKVGLTQDTNKAGIKYAKLDIKIGEPLTDMQLSEIIAIRHQYMELVRSMGLTPDDYDTTNTVDATTTPADDPDLAPS